MEADLIYVVIIQNIPGIFATQVILVIQNTQ